MRRKTAASVVLALASAIIYPLMYMYMVGPSVPVPLQGLFMICLGWWMVLMITKLAGAIPRPGDPIHGSKPPRRP